MLAAACFLSVPASAQVKAVKLNPITDWVTQRDGDTCTTTRKFGDRSQPTTLSLRNRDPWNGGFHVGISSEKYALSGAEFRAGWLPNGRFISIPRATLENAASATPTIRFRHGLWDGKMPAKGAAGYEEYWSRNDQDEILGPRTFKKSVEGFLVNGAFERPLLFATGPMDAVFDARDACIKEMLVAMGVDPADEKRGDHRVEMANLRSLGRYIIGKAPETIRYRGNWGGISFLLYIDADTNVTSCRLNSLPYDREYEQLGCNLLKRKAKFRFKKGENAQPTFFKVSG